jgi:hypothetical protein
MYKDKLGETNDKIVWYSGCLRYLREKDRLPLSYQESQLLLQSVQDTSFPYLMGYWESSDMGMGCLIRVFKNPASNCCAIFIPTRVARIHAEEHGEDIIERSYWFSRIRAGSSVWLDDWSSRKLFMRVNSLVGA